VNSFFKQQTAASRAGLFRCAALILVALAVGASSAQATNVTIDGLYATGVGDNNLVLPGGTLDPHYVLTSSDDKAHPAPTAYVVTSTDANPFPPAWLSVPNTATSAWISANPLQTGAGAVGLAGGSFMYELTFTIPSNVDPTQTTISGHWAADDVSLIYVNGNYISPYTNISFLLPPFQPVAQAFNITGAYQTGVNHIEFVVVNTTPGSTSGLMVTDIQGSGPLIPEPSTVILSLLGAVGLGVATWRNRRKV
jgi:hypothetical protein